MKATRWLSLYLLSLPSLAAGQRVLQENRRFNPEDRVPPNQCDIPPVPHATNVEPDVTTFCPSTQVSLSNLTVDQQTEIATAYAPVLFFHPLEPYSMQSVGAILDDPSKGRILYKGSRNREIVFSDTLNLTKLIETARDLNLGLGKQNYFLEQKLAKDYVDGAGFDDQGRSNAPIYYNMFQHPNGSWIINYFMFYAYHGASDIGVSMAVARSRPFVTFNLRPYGEHEGDWQSMSIMLCPSVSEVAKPLAVSYTQRTWRQITDCTAGECVFYNDSIRPVGFVARASHSIYPSSSSRMIYKELRTEYFFLLQGVVALDETNYLSENGTYQYFAANSTNVRRIKSPAEISLNGTLDRSNLWMGFAGRWGGQNFFNLSGLNDSLPLGQNFRPPLPSCQNDNATGLVPCPFDNRIFELVLQMLNIVESKAGALVRSATALGHDVSKTLLPGTGDGPRGPAAHPVFNRWLPGASAPIHDEVGANISAADYCLGLTTVQPSIVQPQTETVNLRANIYGMLSVVVILIAANVLVLTIPKLRGSGETPLAFDEDGVVQPPSSQFLRYVFQPAFTYTLSFICTICGYVLFFYGYSLLIDALYDTLGQQQLGVLPLVPYFLCLIVVLIDLVAIIFIWRPARNLWRSTNIAYYELVGDDDSLEMFSQKICCRETCCDSPCIVGTKAQKVCCRTTCCEGGCALVTFMVLYGALSGAFFLTVLAVLIGTLNAGIAYVIADFCGRLQGTLDGICVNLAFWGISIPCGRPFYQFCSAWSGQWTIDTLWGAILILIGQYYLIGSTGAATALFQNVPLSLQLLPTREEYQKHLSTVLTRKSELEEGVRDESGKTARVDEVDKAAETGEEERQLVNENDAEELVEDQIGDADELPVGKPQTETGEEDPQLVNADELVEDHVGDANERPEGKPQPTKSDIDDAVTSPYSFL